MKKLLIFLALGFAACTHKAPSHDVLSRSPQAEKASYGTIPRSNIPEENRLTFPKLMSTIHASKSTTIAQTLKALRGNYTDYLKFHTLMYSSRSLQAGSFVEPRALVFGPEAKFMFTFNGNPSQRGGSSIETAEFDSVAMKYNFREILFKKEHGKIGNYKEIDLEKNEVAFETASLIVTHPNPAKCMRCHLQTRPTPLPLFDAYFIWPGAFGSHDDGLTSAFALGSDQTVLAHSRFFHLKPGQRDFEAEGFKQHLSGRLAHPRFKYLPLRVPDKLIAKIFAGDKTSYLANQFEAREENRRLESSSVWPNRPNLLLNALIYDRVGEIIINDLKAAGVKEKLRSFFAEFERAYNSGPELTNSSRDKLLKPFEAKLGHFAPYLERQITEEFLYQCDKFKRTAENIGDVTLIANLNPLYTGYSVSRQASLIGLSAAAAGRISADLAKEKCEKYGPLYAPLLNDAFRHSFLTYVLKYFDFNLESYTTNLNRHPTFHDQGIEIVIRYLTERQ